MAVAASRALRGQPPQQEPTYSSETRVVNVLATVRTKHGEIVKNLTKQDFSLAEEGRPQVIRYFAQESDLPLTLGLLVDTSGSQRRLIGEEVSATRTFLDQVLRDKDQGFLIHFDHEAELLQDVTPSRPLLQRALQDIGQPTLQRGGGGYPGGGGGGYPGGGGGRRNGGGGGGGGGTVLYDAVLLSADELMSHQKGRKALIVLTDGVDQGSKVTLSRAIEAAQRSDSMVYALMFEDKDAYNGGPRFGGMGGGRHGGGGGGRFPQQEHADGRKVMQQMARETGGGYFEVSKKTSLAQVYAQVEEELRNQYSLGYTPDSAANGGYRRIQLTTAKKDLVVQARDGYFADK